MSLLSTMLAFALVPLAKKPAERDKQALTDRCKELVYALGQSEGRADALQGQLAEERMRGELDRAQTRHWRSQADYWQSAYTQLAVPNQHGYERQLQRYEQFSQQAQQLQQHHQAAQQFLGGQGFAQQNYQGVGWLDCTCVPGRAEALMRGATAAEGRLRPGTPD